MSVGAGSSETSASNDLLLKADAVVVACGSYSAPLLRTVGVDLPIYPGKGYSATFKLLKPEAAPWISTIDDEAYCAMTPPGRPAARGRHHRAERLRHARSTRRWPARAAACWPSGWSRCCPACATRAAEEEGGQPHFWTGLRPATPTNIPFIGRTKVGKLWVNAGHGTLGWTHGAGSGKAMAALMSGERAPIAGFGFYGMD